MSWQQPGSGWNPNQQPSFNPQAGAFYPPGFAPPQQQQQQQWNNNNNNNNYNNNNNNYNNNNNNQQQGGRRVYVCDNCGRTGHMANYCRFPAGSGMNQQQNNNNNNNNNNDAGASSSAPSAPVPEAPKTVSAADALNKKQANVNLADKKPGGKAKSISLSFGKKKATTTEESASASQPSSPVEEKKETPTTANEADNNDDDESKKTTSTTAKPSGKKSTKKVNKLRQKEYVRDPRPHFNVVFCGHVDSGKSTCSGHLLSDFGLVDEREMEKLRREAEANHREGWEFAYVMDLSEEERAKGKTHETGAAYLETKERRVTILDAPGHNAFVGSMIGGAAQADIAVMIISAKTGEFESGFNKGGQTREHAMLVRSCGVRHMIIGVNKMDECGWDQERYDQILKDIGPYFKQNGFTIGQNATPIPISGLSGLGLTKPLPKDVCGWYNEGPSLIDYINKLELPASKGEDDELCVPLVGAYKDEFGKTFIYGKIEAGSVVIGDELVMLPGNRTFTVEGIQVENTELEKAYPNDNVHIRVRGLEEGEVHTGFVVTTPESKYKAVEYIQARVVILDARNLISAGSKAILHVHTAAEEITFHSLLAKIDRKTFEPIEKAPKFVKPGEAVLARLELGIPMVVQEAKDFDKLGRFVLRDQSKTIAIGMITKLYESTKEEISKKEGGNASTSAVASTA